MSRAITVTRMRNGKVRVEAPCGYWHDIDLSLVVDEDDAIQERIARDHKRGCLACRGARLNLRETL